ncbi:MAG: methyl-accepting chemotaxis protein [Gammaproteobacteria bacterium]|jgi:methyl-accepting chemotaxis protein|nr:methyl-accepting chemotaxis protein [Gammaproteobacteria bacterium]
MSNKMKNRTSSFWVIVMTLGILGCLGGVTYTFFMIQQEAGQEGDHRLAAQQMRLLTQQIAANSRATVQGEKSAFEALENNVGSFTMELQQMQSIGLNSEIKRVKTRWEPVIESARTLSGAGDRVVFLHSVSNELEKNIKPIQSEFAEVVDILGDEQVSSGTIMAAQKTLWLTERIARNIEKILAGGEESQAAADEFRTDAADFIRIVDALNNGSRVMGVEKVRDLDVIESIQSASNLFAVVSTSIEEIANSSTEMREAALARETIIRDVDALNDAVSALEPAIEKMMLARLGDRSTLMVLFGLPALLAVGMLVFMYRSQRRRVEYTEKGVAEINGALVRISEGDLTIQVPENNTVTREIAREINASTERQRQLIRNIKTPFEVSKKEITEIGISAEGQVNKGRKLTVAVADSIAATTEMVRTSEKIKASTAEAATTSERNRQRVSQGYELTKDMSKASADVREAVQETSKSAKRQGELIQSVTAAAEYIQALNTKISVVAINTRIEAEKAGEHGRPFLGIAEAIGDLLREAEEEGRKIISEVRMLQNLSADNLASMENTVGTVVTILEYIDRLDSSLEEINAGSSAISSIITSVDDAAGRSADTAREMNAAMDEIRERNLDISEYSESTQVGVSSLQDSMRAVAESLSQFKIEDEVGESESDVNLANVESLEQIQGATVLYREEEMQAMEEGQEERASA